MSGNKHFEKIAWIVTALMVLITILFINGGAFGLKVTEYVLGYEKRLFDNTRIHTIDIVMEEWDEFIDNATSEEYYTAAMVIDGEAYKNVGIRGKGNTSLSSVASMGSERYSFKVEFDHYDNSITYHGLDKLSLNNLIQDSTMMKDYLTYTMMNEFDASAPLCSFVYITVNGEDWGLYLAVEGVEDSFLKRNYGSDYGELYKPDSMSFGGGRGNGKDFNMDEFMNREGFGEESKQGKTSADREKFDPSAMFGGGMPDMEKFEPPKMSGGFGGFGMGSSDVKLQYIDDNISSYSNIWNNAKTDIAENDKLRLIDSLKKLSNGENVESVVNIDKVIRYFVVHNYVCNGDSYTGSIIHNYYLYEENGQLEMLPWDYNLAFGTFQGGNAQSTVNTPVDAPVSGGAGEDRPMWHWIVSDEEYTQMYHQYFAEFLNTVDVQSIINNAYNLIKPYVEKDPTAFFTCEEFENGVETLRQFCNLRTLSVKKQLETGETTTNMGFVDASLLTTSDMGSMGGGRGGFGGMPGMDRNKGGFGNDEAPAMPDGFGGQPEGFDSSQIPNGFGGQMPSMGSMPEGFDPSQMQNGFGGKMSNMGEVPKGFDPTQMPNGFGGMTQGQPSEETEKSDGNAAENNGRPSRDNMQMPGGEFRPNMNGTSNTSSNKENMMWLGASAIILALGLIIAKLYKR
ncbi:MAG: CotH kinase family protein [Firmicutes bacterium]|nr:CotH kinase family protein [Bacillota bacterium]